MKFKKVLSILNPQPQVGSLEITDVDLKFCEFKFYNPVFHSLKLENGIVKDGKIIDRDKFIASLSELHKKITNSGKKKINIIVNIPDNNIYSQFFNLPNISNTSLEEAAKLNLQMISPINFESAYSDWQIIDANHPQEGNQLEILGSFASKEIIDVFEECLRKAGFIAAAIEFSGLALLRSAAKLGMDVDLKNPFILLYIGPNGLSFNLARNGNLYFNHFVSWQSIYADQRRIAFDSFKKIIIEEIKKVSSFYSTHWGGQITDFYFLSYGLEGEISKTISENFPFKIKPLLIQKYKDVSSQWFSALGSALRGTMPRSEDNIISVASIGTEKEFYREKIIWFIKIWRNIIISSLLVLFITFLGINAFLINLANSLDEKLSAFRLNNQGNVAEISRLRSEVEEINKKIQLVSLAYQERLKWSLFFGKIKEFAGSNISITRIFFQSFNTPILINALASSEETALEFKEKISDNLDAENIEMPINKIISTIKSV